METTRLSSKGQIIIPKWLRDLYQWESGFEFIVIDTGQGVLLKPSRPFEPSTLEDVAGSLAYDGPSITIEEMDEAIGRAIAEGKHGRG
jgi:AbrB family looped-hinge helix DNA binding protein